MALGRVRFSPLFILASFVCPMVVAEPAEARVVRFVVEQTRPVLDGKSFGAVGAYERLDGTVYFEVDPRDPLNAVIVNIDNAPGTPSGMVGFSAPFYILKPVEIARGNHKIFYGVNNRGNKLEYAWRTFLPAGANSNDPTTEKDLGDSLLLRLGYAYVDAGWQGSGKRDGILKRPATDPLVFQVDSANEFWQMNASLNVVDGAGRPVEVPSHVRLYFASSFQHGGGTGLLNPPGPVGMCQQQTQGNSWAPTLRALLVALDAWADRGLEPPPSNYPRLDDGTLVTVAEARAAFPRIPGVTFPSVINELAFPDFGPDFSSTGGRIVKNPPTLGARYQLFVPRPDADGLDVAGIRPMEVAAPVATITGWALRAPGRREGSLCGLSGSFVPFAQTRAARQQTGDPRPSLEERYGDGSDLVKVVTEAGRKLVGARFLLQEDAVRYVQAAKDRARAMSSGAAR